MKEDKLIDKKMISLSVTIITFNEEKNIARCIESVQDIADEIVVVDSFSTDNTKQICLSYGIRFFEEEWQGYTQTKNLANKYARNDIVLSLDADEALSDELREHLKYVLNNWDFDAYQLDRLTNYCGKWIKHCGWYPDTKLRLWDKRKGEWSGGLHEEVVMQSGAKAGKLKGDLLHYSYYSIKQHMDQVNKFTDIGSQQAYEKGKKSSVLTILTKSIWKFIRDYFVKLGILDGYYGFVISAISAHATFLKYVKLKELHKNSRHE